jgi:hypothetical protein
MSTSTARGSANMGLTERDVTNSLATARRHGPDRAGLLPQPGKRRVLSVVGQTPEYKIGSIDELENAADHGAGASNNAPQMLGGISTITAVDHQCGGQRTTTSSR